MPDLGLLMDMGTGKTRTMIEIMRRRYAHNGRLMRTLVLAPIKVVPNWKSEFKQFSKINPHDIVELTGSGKKRVRDFIDKVGEDLTGRAIFVTNYQAMEMDDLYKLILQWRPEVLVCDESQRLKNPQSVRAKKLVQISDHTCNNYILTGTPILNSAMDIFMQFRILDRGATFGKNFFSFRGKYFEDENAGMRNKLNYFPKWGPRKDADNELQARIRTKSLRVLKSECLDLPPMVRQMVYAEMAPSQARAYKEMYNEFITFIESKAGEPRAVVAQLAITKALRLQQIVTGFVKDDKGETHRLEPCPRVSVLEELLEDLCPQHKVIVWASFKENYKQIAEVCARLKLGYRELHGGIKEKLSQTNMEEFRKDPGVSVLIANQAAGGVGVNLVEASYAIYFSKSFRLEDDLQSEARNYRGGSEMHEKVTRIDIVSKGTIDELINEALANKQQISDKILGWKEVMWTPT